MPTTCGTPPTGRWTPTRAWQWRADGHGTEPLTQNCSGKHAGMLATCVAAGWPTQDYLDPAHPLQVATREAVAELTGVPVEHATVDGCGAPLFSTTLRGLARSFARARVRSTGSPRRAGRAMSAHPWHVAGTGRDATRFMEAVPGLVAKDGADGVYAAGLPDGGAVALKIAGRLVAAPAGGARGGARRGRRGSRRSSRPSA